MSECRAKLQRPGSAGALAGLSELRSMGWVLTCGSAAGFHEHNIKTKTSSSLAPKGGKSL
jgi:hypothetical protein